MTKKARELLPYQRLKFSRPNLYIPMTRQLNEGDVAPILNALFSHTGPVWDFSTATRDEHAFRSIRDKSPDFDLRDIPDAPGAALVVWVLRCEHDTGAVLHGRPLDDIVAERLRISADSDPDAREALTWLCDPKHEVYKLSEAPKVAARLVKEWSKPDASAPASGFPTTDTGNAERFAARHSDRARFCWEWNTWLAWDGKRWTRDAGAEVERLAKATARGIYAEAADQPDDGARAELVKHAKRSESRKGRTDFLALARSEEGIPIQPKELDAAPQLVNLLSGTLDLDAEEFREHRRGDMLTRLFPVAFDPSATAPTWEAALAQWLPDIEIREFVQDAAGASLSGLAYDEFWMFLFGDGANGKSTFMRVLEWLFGDYGHKAQAETFMDCGRDRDRGKPAPELLSMQGKRLITVQETAQRHRLNEALIKDLTGRDTITARGIQAKNETTFAPQFTLWMFGNHKPQISDTSAGTWRRIRLIPFTQTIPEEGRDPQLSDKLRAELPGILNWALEGLARVMARGFVIPDAVKAATEQYRAENDALAGFLASCCDLSETAFVSSGDLWEAWRTYCQETGEKEGTAKTLGLGLKDKRFKDSRRYLPKGQTRVWNGLRLKPQEG